MSCCLCVSLLFVTNALDSPYRSDSDSDSSNMRSGCKQVSKHELYCFAAKCLFRTLPVSKSML